MPPPPFTVDTERHLLHVDGRSVELQPRVLHLLLCLAARPGQLVAKGQLLDEVWGHRFITEGVIKTAMSELRAALGDDVKQPRWIETLPRRGYRYIGAAPLTQALPAAAPARPTAPQPSAPRPASPLIGRDEALAALHAAWAAACQGRPAVLLVAGDAGMGKTALLSEFMHGLDDEDAVVAVGQCAEALGEGEPYLAILEALSPLLAQQPALQPELRRVAPTWLHQMPWHVPLEERELLAREVAGASQERMLREFAMLLEQATRAQPWLLVLEDLHWSDSASVQLLGHLARRRGSGRWLVVGSFRPIDVAASEHPLGDMRRELRLHGQVREVALSGLGEDQLGQLIAQRLPGANAPADFLAELQRHTDGLPLFVERVLTELLDQGLLQREADGHWRFPATGHALPLPATLIDLMERQIDRLPAATRQMLEVAALAPNEFDDLVLAQVLDTSPADIRQRLDGLVRRRLWLLAREPHLLPGAQVATRYGFQHALMRHAFEQRTSAAGRVALHRRLGQAVEAVHGSASAEHAVELAEHARRGHEPQRAAHWYSLAALQALQRIAPHPALELVRLGMAQLGLAEPGPAADGLRVGLLLTRMRALVTTRGYSVGEARTCIEQAFALVAPWPLGRESLPIWHATFWTRQNAGQWPARDELIQRLQAAQSAAGDDDWAIPAVLANMRGNVASHAEQPQQALPLLEQALRLYDSHRQPGEHLPLLQDFEIDTLCHLYACLVQLGEAGRAAAVAERVEARLAAGVDPLSEGMALFFLSFGAQLHGAEARLAALNARALALLAARETLPGAGPHGVMAGWVQCQAGELHAGIARMQQALRIYAEQGTLSGRMHFLQLLARQALNAGDLPLAEQSLNACDELYALGETLGRGDVLRTRAAWHARRSAGPASRAAALQVLDDAEAYARPRGLRRLLVALAQDRADLTAQR